MNSAAKSEGSEDSTGRRSTLRRIRNELAIEALLVVIGFALAFGLTTKIMVAVAFTCLKFAIPDWITAWLVVRCDPDRWHGRAIGLLFVALGFLRASIFAFAALIIILGSTLLSEGPPGKLAAAGFGTAFLCAYGFLATVFPLSLLAAIIAWKTNNKLEFAMGLTKLRRSNGASQSQISLDVWQGLKFVGIGSGVSLAVTLIAPLIVLPSLIFGFAAFIAPFVWMPIFWSLTTPQQ